jgi:hypothetical protein
MASFSIGVLVKPTFQSMTKLTWLDGDWFPTVVDGRLYLEKPEFSAVYEILNTSKRKLSAQDYQNQVLSNSQALYFTASSDPQETWVPLLEKAFARSHGDYGAIKGLYHGYATCR